MVKDNNSKYKRFEIEASECDLQIGSRVTPETIIGRDFETGEMMAAGCRGRVASINFNATDHTLIVVVTLEKNL
jgi:hypothetical protein